MGTRYPNLPGFAAWIREVEKGCESLQSGTWLGSLFCIFRFQFFGILSRDDPQSFFGGLGNDLFGFVGFFAFDDIPLQHFIREDRANLIDIDAHIR